jgi:hypothetical protein
MWLLTLVFNLLMLGFLLFIIVCAIGACYIWAMDGIRASIEPWKAVVWAVKHDFSTLPARWPGIVKELRTNGITKRVDPRKHRGDGPVS